MTRPRVLPPGPGISTRAMQARVRARVLAYGREVHRVLRPLMLDLNGPKRAPKTLIEKLAAGGALALPRGIGAALHPEELAAWLDRAEYPLLRVAEGALAITSGADVLARAVGAGARAVDVMIRERGTVQLHSMRLTPGITRAQLSSALYTIPDPFKLGTEVDKGMREAAAQSVRAANAQVAALDVGRPFVLGPDTTRPFAKATRVGTSSAEALEMSVQRDLIAPLRTRALPGPKVFEDSDVGGSIGDTLDKRAAGRVDVRARQAARSVDSAAHSADSDATEGRNEKLSISRYMWVTSRDERVRQMHKDLDGTVHDWSDPPVADKTGERYHPGKKHGCRCTASALVEDVLSALDGDE